MSYKINNIVDVNILTDTLYRGAINFRAPPVIEIPVIFPPLDWADYPSPPINFQGIATDGVSTWFCWTMHTAAVASRVFKSTDNRVTWVEQIGFLVNSTTRLTSMVFSNGTWLAAMDANNYTAKFAIRRSIDGGVSWIDFTSFPYGTSFLGALASDGAGNWGVIKGNHLYVSYNDGVSFAYIYPSPPQFNTCGEIKHTSHGWFLCVVGEHTTHGKVYKGATLDTLVRIDDSWSVTNPNIRGVTVNSDTGTLIFYSGNAIALYPNGFVSSLDNLVLRSTDGGVSVDEVLPAGINSGITDPDYTSFACHDGVWVMTSYTGFTAYSIDDAITFAPLERSLGHIPAASATIGNVYKFGTDWICSSYATSTALIPPRISYGV